jgi:hypothetical protein
MDANNQPLSPEVRPGGETLPNVTPEEAGTAAPNEAGKQAAQNAPATPPPGTPAPTAQQPQATTPVIVGPAIADDVDVIEKEWVDHAEEIVRATKDDPYREEEAVEDLQIDYLQKRYGKNIEKSSDQ